MHRVNEAGMALLALFVGAVVFLTASFLPFFIGEVWGPLWGVEWWPAGTVRSFGRLGPASGISPWADLLAVPLALCLLLVTFLLVAGSLVLFVQGSARQAR